MVSIAGYTAETDGSVEKIRAREGKIRVWMS